MVVTTTLTDTAEYPKEDILDLYHDRWHVELAIRTIKQMLNMDILRCKSPAMVRKEVWAHLLVYNLVRQAMAQAAATAECHPRTLSFTGALQALRAFRDLLQRAANDAAVVRVGKEVLVLSASERVGDRPGRVEPRAVKRRPKEYARLMKPRAEARAELLRA